MCVSQEDSVYRHMEISQEKKHNTRKVITFAGPGKGPGRARMGEGRGKGPARVGSEFHTIEFG